LVKKEKRRRWLATTCDGFVGVVKESRRPEKKVNKREKREIIVGGHADAPMPAGRGKRAPPEREREEVSWETASIRLETANDR